MLTIFTIRAFEKSPMCRVANRFREDESGATAIEYSLIVSLIFLAILGAVNSFGASSNEMYTTIESEITTAIN